jgi:glycosyltransferase 2 family protein
MLKPINRSAAKTWQFWLKLAGSLALLSFLLARTDLHAIGTLFRSLRFPIFFASIFLYILAQMLSVVRWRCLLLAEKINIPFWRLTLLYFEGMFFNLMLPTSIGGDVIRGYRVFQMTRRDEASLASILVERLSGFVALAIIACLAMIPAYTYLNDPVVVWLVVMAATGVIGIVAGLLSVRLQTLFFRVLNGVGLGRFHERLERLHESIRRYWTHRQALLQAVGLSLILQSLVIMIFYLTSRALNLSVDVRYFFLFVPLINVISMLPVSIAGLGLREGSSVYFFSKVGLDSAGAISLSLLFFAVTALCSGLGGIAFLVGHPQHQMDP